MALLELPVLNAVRRLLAEHQGLSAVAGEAPAHEALAVFVTTALAEENGIKVKKISDTELNSRKAVLIRILGASWRDVIVFIVATPLAKTFAIIRVRRTLRQNRENQENEKI